MPKLRRLFPILVFTTGTLLAHASTSDNLIDINTATPLQLKALPGLGDAYIRRIIEGRPYTAKNQLVTRGILPQTAYDKISASIVAKHPAR